MESLFEKTTKIYFDSLLIFLPKLVFCILRNQEKTHNSSSNVLKIYQKLSFDENSDCSGFLLCCGIYSSYLQLINN